MQLAKVDDVGASVAKGMLREGCASIAIINIGDSPRWCFGDDALATWKTEIRDHLVEPDQPILLDDFPGGYCYAASRWSAPAGDGDVLVFFMHH
jgi:hypothetical protein